MGKIQISSLPRLVSIQSISKAAWKKKKHLLTHVPCDPPHFPWEKTTLWAFFFGFRTRLQEQSGSTVLPATNVSSHLQEPQSSDGFTGRSFLQKDISDECICIKYIMNIYIIYDILITSNWCISSSISGNIRYIASLYMGLTILDTQSESQMKNDSTHVNLLSPSVNPYVREIMPRNWDTMLLLSADFASNCQHFQGVCATRNQEMQRQRQRQQQQQEQQEQQQQQEEEVPIGKFEGSPPPLLGALKLQSVAHHRHIARHISRTFLKSRQPALSPASSAKVVVAKKTGRILSIILVTVD